MEKGSIRGNIFLLLITTAGCSFFFLPYYAKKNGLVLSLFLLLLPACLSYYSKYYSNFVNY
jgi:amino acid permease